jgi:hypothetical protein
MYFTPYVKQDGYWESVCSLQRALTPVLKCRTVLKEAGNYESIVRDFFSGMTVAHSFGSVTLDIARDTAQNLAVDYINSEMVQTREN